MITCNKDFLYIFDATNCNPNGDADQENKPRFDYDTKTLLVSDVRRKRDIRDFLINKNFNIFVRTLNDKKVTMDVMLSEVKKTFNFSDKTGQDEIIDVILDNMIDMRLFGSAMAMKGMTKAFTGPVQLTWGYSLHPVDLVKSNAIVTIMNDDNSTFGKMYKVHYAMVAHGGSLNKFAAKKTRLKEKDFEIFRACLVQSMMNNLSQSKIGQRPLCYLEVTYNENFDGYLGDLRRYLDCVYEDVPIRNINHVRLDFSRLNNAIDLLKEKGYVKEISIWVDNDLTNFINLPSGEKLDLIKPIE